MITYVSGSNPMWAILNFLLRYDETIVMAACAMVALKAYRITRKHGYAVISAAFIFWALWSHAIPMYSCYMDSRLSQDEIDRDQKIRDAVAQVYKEHGYPEMHIIPNLLMLPIGGVIVFLGLWMLSSADRNQARTLPSSVPLTRGTPPAGQEPRHGSRSAHG